jgi:hypothetical protein
VHLERVGLRPRSSRQLRAKRQYRGDRVRRPGREEVSVNASDSGCLFVGVDLGDERFQVCVAEPTGASGEQRSFAHDGEGIGEAMAWLSSTAVERNTSASWGPATSSGLAEDEGE